MDDLLRRGVQRLDGLPASELNDRLRAYRPERPVDVYVWLSCGLALESMSEGNYGVGAVIVRDGEVVAEGRNRLIQPHVRTDSHAEMDAVNQFEERFRDVPDALGATLYTSLECCPMCTVRLINTGIRDVFYAAADPDGGMPSRFEGLPPFWRRLSEQRDPPQRFLPAPCAPELSELAAAIFHASDAALDVRMRAR